MDMKKKPITTAKFIQWTKEIIRKPFSYTRRATERKNGQRRMQQIIPPDNEIPFDFRIFETMRGSNGMSPLYFRIRILEVMRGSNCMSPLYCHIAKWCVRNKNRPYAIKEGHVWFIITDEEFVNHFGYFTLPDFQKHKAGLIEEGWLVTGDFLNDNGEKITLVRPDWDRLMDVLRLHTFGEVAYIW